jgi:hypothetical protein
VIFLLAVKDVLPQHLAKFDPRPWINVSGIGLCPESWERDELFRPRSKPRDVTALTREIGRLFKVKSTTPKESKQLL